MAMSLRKAAERAAAVRLANLNPSAFRAQPGNYTATPRENLIATVREDDFWDDLSLGSGSELYDRNGVPAKFCAAHSSSALAVNCFGPFKRFPERLRMSEIGHFRDFGFE
jgi:hypothetical protein